MRRHKSIEHLQDQQGWNDTTLLDLVLEYVEHVSEEGMPNLIGHLDLKIQDLENPVGGLDR